MSYIDFDIGRMQDSLTDEERLRWYQQDLLRAERYFAALCRLHKQQLLSVALNMGLALQARGFKPNRKTNRK